MKKLAYMPTIAAVAIGLSLAGAAQAHHDKGSHANGGFAGIFEAPLVTPGDTGGLVDGSEGKFNEAGRWKVETSGFEADADVQICIDAATLMEPAFLADVVADEDGEVKSGDDIAGPLDPGNYQAPSFQVYSGSPGGCLGTLEQESGLTVN